MSILIKGLDLTEDSCSINLTICSNGKVYGSQQVGDSMVRINTTAVALSECGDLVDRDELLKVDNITCVNTGYWETDYDAVKVSVIKNAPAIVEATK